MTRRGTPPITARLADETAERIRRNHEQRLLEAEARPRPVIIADQVLAPGANVAVAHKLGRRPQWVGVSCVRGALNVGIVRDVTAGPPGLFNSPVDPTQVVMLRADGYNATVTVNVLVY